MEIVLIAAAPVSVDRRDQFLKRVIARLQLKGRNFSDVDILEACELAKTGLVHRSTDAASRSTQCYR
jgi:hypothetical protein